MNYNENIRALEEQLKALRSQRQHEGAEKLADLVETLHATVAEAKTLADEYGLAFNFDLKDTKAVDDYWDSSSNC